MANLSEHIRKARNNEVFATTFWPARSRYADWAITVYFYAAVHFVEAYFATIEIHCNNHGQRNQEVAKRFPRRIASHYLRLYRESRRARYEVTPVAKVYAQNLLVNHFQPLRAYLLSLLP